VDRIDRESLLAAFAGKLPRALEKRARLFLLARGVEGASALEQGADARPRSGACELRLDLVEEAVRGCEVLAQTVGARNLREELETLVAARAFRSRPGPSIPRRSRCRCLRGGSSRHRIG